MPNRLFSRQYTNSYKDLIRNKNYRNIRYNKFQLPKNIPYNLYLYNLQNTVKKCELTNICYNSPINIVQAKTSYRCQVDIPKTCNVENVLYPYGYYLCDNSNCTVCVTDPSYNAYLCSGNSDVNIYCLNNCVFSYF